MPAKERFAQALRLFAENDQDTRPERAQRYMRLTKLMPRSRSGLLLPGGLSTLRAIEETQKAFVEGRWLATIFTAYASFMNATAAAHAVESGRPTSGHLDRSDILARLDVSEAKEVAEVFDIFDRYWLPQWPAALRSFFDEVIAEDAERIFTIVGRYFHRHFDARDD
jgi:hypothetical protein